MNKQERGYRVIRERILDGTYGPGYRLVIDAIADELRVSAVPVREAIRRLEAEGLVVYQANAGARVAPVDPAEWESAMTVLAVLEGYATATAAPLLTPGDIAGLRAVNVQMTEALAQTDVLAFGRLNKQFHAEIVDRCPNSHLVALVHDTNDRLDAVRRTVFTHIPYRGLRSVDEHAQLIDLLASGAAPAEIEGVAREHKLRTVEVFRRRRDERERTVEAPGGRLEGSEKP